MAALFACDRCRTQVPAEGDERRDWSAVSVAKVTSPTVPFQKLDLCKPCSDGLRRFLQETPEAPR